MSWVINEAASNGSADITRLSLSEVKATGSMTSNTTAQLRVSAPPMQYGDDAGASSAGTNFLSILERELVHPTTFTQTFLQSILSSIDSKDPVVANAWLETLLDVIDLLPSHVIRHEILNIAISKGQISQPVASRVACCKLLGKIASKFEPYLTQQEVLPLVLSLCQDVQCEVRSSMCSQLAALARGLGCDLARPALLPSLVELASDEEPQVRITAVQAVADILGLLDHESRQQIIVPLVRKLCEGALRSEDPVLLAVAKQIGYLSYSLSDQMCVEDIGWFVHFYEKVCQLGAPLAPSAPMPDIVPVMDRAEMYAECRHLCAFNLPGMMLVGLRVEPEILKRVFCDLASDICFNVRKTIASSIHEVCRMLGAEGCGAMVRSQLAGLLCDNSEEVLEALVPHLATTLELLVKSGALNTAEESSELCRSVLHCEEELSQTNKWRLQAQMLDHLSCLPHCISAELIFKHFVPRMFTKMHKARPLPCRVAAARSLLVFLNHLSADEKHRAAILARLETEFVRGESCYSRMLFLRMCPDAMSILSTAFFKQHLFCNVLKLAGDRVANIQLEVCSLLCPLKQLLRLPSDRHLLHELESCVGSLLLSAKDRDVNAALATAIQQLDKIEIAEGKNSRNVNRNEVTRRSISSRNSVSRPSSSLRLQPQQPQQQQPDNRLTNKIKKQETKIPQSTGVKTTVAPNMRKLTRCMSANSMQVLPPPPPVPSTQLCTQCKLPCRTNKPPKLERSHTTLGTTTSNNALLMQRNYYPYSHLAVDPSTDEFYIDAGIRITTKIPPAASANLQEIRKSEDKIESVRSRLELNHISKPNQRTSGGVTMRRPSRNLLERTAVTRRSLPPQDRVPLTSVQKPKPNARPQSCLIAKPAPGENKRHPLTTKIPKSAAVSSPKPSAVNNNKYKLKRDPSPNLDLNKSSGNKTPPAPRFQYQKRSYTAPSSRGSSPDGTTTPRLFTLSSPLPPSRLPRYHWPNLHDFG